MRSEIEFVVGQEEEQLFGVVQAAKFKVRLKGCSLIRVTEIRIVIITLRSEA